MRNLFVMAFAVALMGGCEGVKSLGNLGDTGIQAFALRGENAGSPSWSAGVLVLPDGQLAVIAPSSDPGLTRAILGAGAQLGSAYLFGASIRPDTYTDSSSTVVTSESASDADSKSKSDADADARTSQSQGQFQGQAQGQAQGQNQSANGGRGGDGGRGGNGGAGGNGHKGGHGQGNNPGHDHGDDDD